MFSSKAPNSGSSVRRDRKYRTFPPGSNVGLTSSEDPSDTVVAVPVSREYRRIRLIPVS